MADVPAAAFRAYLVCLIAVTGEPVDPSAHRDRRLASRPQLPECNSIETSPPSCTNRRFSVRVMAIYWFPFNAFDGAIINPTAEFVKGFLKIYAEKMLGLNNMLTLRKKTVYMLTKIGQYGKIKRRRKELL